jgi:hypothetical protein
VTYHDHPPSPECGEQALRRTLASYDRALVYLGFRFDDVPDHFDRVLLRDLEQVGEVTNFTKFPDATRAVVVRLAHGSSTAADGQTEGPALNGCVAAGPAERW